MDLIYKTKTFWAGVVGLVSAAAGFFTGEMDLNQAVQLALTALIGIFLRAGIMKS
jgi:hypothetical protein